MKELLIKWLWKRLSPMVRDEIVLSSISPGLAKQWMSRLPQHDEMLILSELVQAATKGRAHLHKNPVKRSTAIVNFPQPGVTGIDE